MFHMIKGLQGNSHLLHNFLKAGHQHSFGKYMYDYLNFIFFISLSYKMCVISTLRSLPGHSASCSELGFPSRKLGTSQT